MAKIKNKQEIELGFGNKNYSESVRFLNRDGSVNVKRNGIGKHANFDIYHWLITISWTKFIILIVNGYIFINTIFAFIYYFIGADKFGGITIGYAIENFMQLFFFSAQTLTTVGYGHIYPNSSLVSAIAAVESMFGLLGFALATGILYGRFSRPKADIEYSSQALIAPYSDHKAFMFRIANQKQNELIEIECQLALAINNPKSKKRDFHFLDLERQKINFLPTSWTIVHPINEVSPILSLTETDLATCDAEFIILIKAINDTYSQTVYSRMSYKPSEIIWNAKFVPLKTNPVGNGTISMNLKDIHLFEKIQESIS
jgi:inward rectifier potassium channel